MITEVQTFDKPFPMDLFPLPSPNDYSITATEPWYRVEFFIGAEQTTKGESLDPFQVAKDVIRILDEEFGGCTIHQAQGSWIQPDTGLIITEKAVHAIVLVNGNDEVYQPRPRLMLLAQARRIKAEFESMFEQESVPMLVTAVDTVEF